MKMNYQKYIREKEAEKIIMHILLQRMQLLATMDHKILEKRETLSKFKN